MTRTVSGWSDWSGTLLDGAGTISTRSSTLDAVPYTYASRFEGAAGACPEELLAAAYAACYNEALSNISGKEGSQIASVSTTADVTMGVDDRGPAIVAVHLTVEATAPGMSPQVFQHLAEQARIRCAFSKVLVVEPTMNAKLAP
ncbi:OsmC family peroxiredoxin [Catellatospora citrea]|uniref:Peroxiredoxin n=1 Tax=Catellatospora citrea TaxID=53366 RepID=A0A8J3KHQ3_9ACTN|nr:OsmC family peroxiredoxin [Catellatospora citrea]RKE05403.1 osmotically inducible protein OsmC [Catellatospora citrea]GIG00073.1 peroxiredoxin [Catellatospora citrea]